MDAVRQKALREQRTEANVPSPHQVNAVLADAVSLALADPAGRDALATALGPALRRAIKAKGFDPRALDVKRVFGIRMRPSARILEVETSERIAEEVAAVMAHRRRQATMGETIALLDSLRDDD